LTAGHVTAFVPGYYLRGNDNLDVLGIRFYRRRLKGMALRHTVTHLIETCGLILVDLGLLINAGVKTRGRQWPGTLTFAFEALADGLGVLTRGALLVLQTTRTQVDVEISQVLLPRHGRGPAPLQGLDAVLHVGLFVTASWHAKQRLEHIMTGQCLVTRMQLPLPAAVNRRRHGLGVVPPNFPWHTAEKLEPLHHACQDRFGTLARQSQRERTIRVRPYQHQHGYLLAPLGKIDVDVPEVRFQPLARITR
jgi:hypothetical protein